MGSQPLRHEVMHSLLDIASLRAPVMSFATALPNTKSKSNTWLWGLQVQPWQLWSQQVAPAPASQAIPPHPVHALPEPSLHAR